MTQPGRMRGSHKPPALHKELPPAHWIELLGYETRQLFMLYRSRLTPVLRVAVSVDSSYRVTDLTCFGRVC